MKAVCTTFGCCAAAAAPTAWLPFVVGPSNSPLERLFPLLFSAEGLLSIGGPIGAEEDGVTSIRSIGGVNDEVEDGNIGIVR